MLNLKINTLLTLLMRYVVVLTTPEAQVNEHLGLWVVLSIIITIGLFIGGYFLFIALTRKEVIGPFSVARVDILSRLAKMAEDDKNYPGLLSVKERNTEMLPDGLYVNEKAFLFIYETKAVTRIVARLNESYGAKLKRLYKLVEVSNLGGEVFYDITITAEFRDFESIYRIIDHAYNYTLRN